MNEIDLNLSFDDVLLKPAFSKTLPNAVKLDTYITSKVKLDTPLISAAMDTVTESETAIRMSQLGGIGCIHRNMPIKQQAMEVKRVKTHESWIVDNPVVIESHATIGEAQLLQQEYGVSGIPVINKDTQLLEGVITNRDIRSNKQTNTPVKDLMTTKNLITVQRNVDRGHALSLLHKHKIERLIVVDKNNRCIGLITLKDIIKCAEYPDATKDDNGKLRTAAAIGVGDSAIERTEALVKEGVDIITIDTAHGHSQLVLDTIKAIKHNWPDLDIIGGNVVTAEGALALIEAGSSSIKVGMGPGSICTTRIVTGVGRPQLSAIVDVASVCKTQNIPLIADGGIRCSGDIAKAIAAGADAVMIGSLFAGTSESPGELTFSQGRSYKKYRGMGSLNAMRQGSSDRYFQSESSKMTAEGVEGLVPFRGDLFNIFYKLIGGLKSSMGYTGNDNLTKMKNNCTFIQLSKSGLNESKAHSIIITQDDSVFEE